MDLPENKNIYFTFLNSLLSLPVTWLYLILMVFNSLCFITWWTSGSPTSVQLIGSFFIW